MNLALLALSGGYWLRPTYVPPAASSKPFDAPWPVWDGVIPAVAPSTTGATYYVSTGVNEYGVANGAPVGSDSNNGTSPDTPFLTIAKARSVVNSANGDVVLFRRGHFRQGIDYSGGAPTATAAKPLVFGTYGDGEVILDGSTHVTGWEQMNGSVWRAPISGWVPIAVVIDGVPLKQITQRYNSPLYAAQYPDLAPSNSTITPGSGKWGWDTTGHYVWADFGSGSPSTSYVIIPNNDEAQNHCMYAGGAYIIVDGLTIVGSGSNGLWTYTTGAGARDGAGKGHVSRRCVFKFNGKAGVVFNGDDSPLVDRCLVYHNVLQNWPRGNYGNLDAGGGWPGACNFSGTLNAVCRGTVSHMNGGEGIISYGNNQSWACGNTLFEQNISFDNWSVQMYIDNQPNDIVRQNFLYLRPWKFRKGDIIYDQGYPYSDAEKFSTIFMSADEYGSGDPKGSAANTGARIYSNIMVGGTVGGRNYIESTPTAGWRDCLFANNTIIMEPHEETRRKVGIYFQKPVEGTEANNNTGSHVQNNIIYGYAVDPDTGHVNTSSDNYLAMLSEWAGTVGAGSDYNHVYFENAQNNTPFETGYNTTVLRTLAAWRSTTGMDANTVMSDPQIVGLAALRSGVTPYDWRNAKLAAGSPARGTGVDLSAYFTIDFEGNTRTAPWSKGAFA